MPGRPAGCQECRIAKKRCDRTLPACLRCVRRNKSCSGPEDLTKIRFCDESHATVIMHRPPPEPPIVTLPRHRVNPSPGEETWKKVDVPDPMTVFLGETQSITNLSILPKPEDLALNCFIANFTSPTPGLWNFMRSYALESKADDCLNLAVQACGMAVRVKDFGPQAGVNYAGATYVNALRLLNVALDDPERNTTDECVIAIWLLGFFEHLTNTGDVTFQSWKAHMNGLGRILRLRGKRQLHSVVGRHLYREIAWSLMMISIWDHVNPPDFIYEWEDDLEMRSTERAINAPADSLTKISFAFARLRAGVTADTIDDEIAFADSLEIDRRLKQWCLDAPACDYAWRVDEATVPASPHFWNGRVHAYTTPIVPGAWLVTRCLTIRNSQLQGDLLRTMSPAMLEDAQWVRHHWTLRRHAADEICVTIPAVLGHTCDSDETSCTTGVAFTLIWPLYLAGMCTMDYGCTGALSTGVSDVASRSHTYTTSEQLSWIVGRLDYISARFGLQLATVMADALRHGTQ